MSKILYRQAAPSLPSLIPTFYKIVVPTIVLDVLARQLRTQVGLDLTFSPRRIIHSHSTLIEAMIAPWMGPASLTELCSRLIQVGVLVSLPAAASVLHLWGFWMAIALIRVPVGFIFTRSVGWALPHWFSHYALYEASAGFGPSVLALVALNPTVFDEVVRDEYAKYVPYTTPLLAAAFAWLENRPWTFGITLSLIIVLAAVVRIPSLYSYLHWLYPCVHMNDQHTDDTGAIEIASPTPRASKAVPQLGRPPLLLIMASLSVLIPFAFIPPTRLPFPTSATTSELSSLDNTTAPLLNVLILSYPRPQGVEISESILTTTLDSFTPHISADVSVSVFTHSDHHKAVEEITSAYPNVTFFVDHDSHPKDVDGHYLHLAEAFRWAEEHPAEWTMLVEDDFPICPGGWSGIIINRSYLDLLQVMLRIYSTAQSPIPEGVYRRAPDQIVQDCILGRPNSVCERREGKTIISSRLVLDHIGGMATTTKGKRLNSDKWRCGWRHAFHGWDVVEVIVV